MVRLRTHEKVPGANCLPVHSDADYGAGPRPPCRSKRERVLELRLDEGALGEEEAGRRLDEVVGYLGYVALHASISAL